VCWCTSEACKYKKRNHNCGHYGFLLNGNIGCKKHAADLAFIAPGFSQALFQESLARKWWLLSEVEAWNFSKNKFSKLVNSVQTGVLIAGLNLNIIIQNKKLQKIAPFMDDALNTSGIKYFNVETWLLFAPPLSKFWIRV